MNTIDSFEGVYSFLSNFYQCQIEFDGEFYPSSEAAYQAAKTLDKDARKVFETLSPAKAKRAGKKVDLRDDWDDVKLNIMHQILTDKFTRHSELKDKLLDTQDCELIEGNWWNDTYWGVCRGKGQNHLGKILMKVRDEIRIKERI